MPLYPNDSRLGYAGLVAVVLGFAIVGAYTLFDLAPTHELAPSAEKLALYQKYGIPGPLKAIYVGSDAPCDDARYQLVLDRWADAGWPRAELVEDVEDSEVWFSGDVSQIPDDVDVLGPDGSPTGQVVHTYAVASLMYSPATEWAKVLIFHRDEDRDGIPGPDVCVDDKLILEHEFGHAAYALDHSIAPGSIMQELQSDARDVFPDLPPSPVIWTAP